MDYVIIRRYNDGREDEPCDWDGVTWPGEGDLLTWRVAKVMAGNADRPAAIVLEPIGE